jgi:hypothetical protein
MTKPSLVNESEGDQSSSYYIQNLLFSNSLPIILGYFINQTSELGLFKHKVHPHFLFIFPLNHMIVHFDNKWAIIQSLVDLCLIAGNGFFFRTNIKSHFFEDNVGLLPRFPREVNFSEAP